MRKAILFFVLGLVVGAAAGVLVPRWAGPRLPPGLRLDETVVEGTVVAKQRRNTQLLLTVDTGDGAVLATFSDKVDEISLLVDEGDLVGLGLRGDEPFADDPPIRRVVKKKPSLEEETTPRPPDRGGEPPEALEAIPRAPQTRPEAPPEPEEGSQKESSDSGSDP